MAVALDVPRPPRAGGSMRPVLEAARETVEGELALRRALRVQTAQARLSARVVTVMPFALVAVFSLVSKGVSGSVSAKPAGVGPVGLGMCDGGCGRARGATHVERGGVVMMYAAALPAIAAVLGAASGACMGWAGAQSVRRARAARARAPDGGRAKGGAQASACLSYLGGFEQAIGVAGHPPGAARRRIARCAGALRGAGGQGRSWRDGVGPGVLRGSGASCRGGCGGGGSVVGPCGVERACGSWLRGGRHRRRRPRRHARSEGPGSSAPTRWSAACRRCWKWWRSACAAGCRFDRSLQLYTGHLGDGLARECAAAQRSWEAGLATRQDALRALAQGYDNPLFSRTVSAIIRSLRFGTSLGEVLEQSAEQARAARKAQVEERVAKAPVKMMIPTGTLILPAMLLLVLGPVLLELMEGM